MTRPTLIEVMAACEADDNLGYCLDCGEEHSGIEPDARRCKCGACGEYRVYGAEEILLMGACDEDSADDEQKESDFIADHFQFIHVGDNGTTRLNTFVDTGNRVLEMPKPKKCRAMSINNLVCGKTQSEYTKPRAIALLEKYGIAMNGGRIIIAGLPCNPSTIVDSSIARSVEKYARQSQEHINRVCEDENLSLGETTPGTTKPHEKETWRKMTIDDIAKTHVCTVNEVYRLTAEKHGKVIAWKFSPDNHVNAIIGFDRKGNRRAVIACIDES